MMSTVEKATKSANKYNGLIIINKPSGFTSHDVVAKVRRILNINKVGHTGTLDPEATGVLPVCVGKGTKVSDMLMTSDKEYIAEVKLGVVTDTQDIFGTVLQTNDINSITSDLINKTVLDFVGSIEQIPPMFSAIKINGQKMYELARKGIEVERKPRKITVYNIDILNFNNGEFTMRVNCSKGTYIRTLCHDIGMALGCGACMKSLVRTKTSVFTIENSVTLEQLQMHADSETVSDCIVGIDSIFNKYPVYEADDEIAKRILNGAVSTVTVDLGMYRVYDKNKRFLAVGEVVKMGNRNKIKVVKAFFDKL